MKIKTIKAKNFSEALLLVKKELGDDAIILGSEESKEEDGFVKIIAAIDMDIKNMSENSFSNQLEGFVREKTTEIGDIKILREEINALREMVEKMHNLHLKNNISNGKKKIVDYLKSKNIWEEECYRLCDSLKDLNDLVNRMEKNIKICSLGSKKILLFIGPTGVGKTTTIAKLCAKLIKEGKKVGIINLDTYRIGAIEQIKTYANILAVPLKTINSVDKIESEIEKMGPLDTIFVDTPGKNPKDISYISELKKIYEKYIPIETHLLLSLTNDSNCLKETYKIYSTIPVDFINFTKVDEAFSYGNIYNILKVSGKPIAYITDGQRVPQDIKFPEIKNLIYMILKNEVVH